MLFRMKFRFTNQQLLCTSAIVMGICNVITMHSQSMPVLMLLFYCGHSQDPGHVRVYEQHPVVDYAKARLRRLLPCAPHHPSHRHRGWGMACCLDGASFYMADDAHLYRRHHVVRAAVTDSAVSSVLSYAQQVLAEGDRLAGRFTHLRHNASVLVHLCLWRSLQVVRKPAYQNGGRLLHSSLQDSPFTG